MTLIMPIWFKYAEWDRSDPKHPRIKGPKKNATKKAVEAYLRDMEEERRASEAKEKSPSGLGNK